jgi:hypothetical protein
MEKLNGANNNLISPSIATIDNNMNIIDVMSDVYAILQNIDQTTEFVSLHENIEKVINKNPKSYLRSKHIYTIFVIGGICTNELCIINELEKKHSIKIIVGSTHIFTPNEFVDHLLNS